MVKAVSALTAAFRLVQLSSCDQRLDVPCLRRVSPHLHHDILENLQKLSFTSMSEMGGTRHHFSQAGRLVASKQIVYSLLQDTTRQPVSTDTMVQLCNGTMVSNTLQDTTVPLLTRRQSYVLFDSKFIIFSSAKCKSLDSREFLNCHKKKLKKNSPKRVSFQV